MPGSERPITQTEIERRCEDLQRRILETKFNPKLETSLAVSCSSASCELFATESVNERELNRRVFAAAEIFRHAAHVYVHRIISDPARECPQEIQESVDAVFELLPAVPDALGPGSNLGWCFTVIGAEVDDEDRREYLRSRLRNINLLAMENTKSAERVLECVWNQRDLALKAEGNARFERWQDTMKIAGQEQVLV